MTIYVNMWNEADKKYKEVFVHEIVKPSGWFEPNKLWPCYTIESVTCFSNYMTIFIKHKEAK